MRRILALVTRLVSTRMERLRACLPLLVRYNSVMPEDPTQRADDDLEFTDMPTARAPDWELVFHDDPETPADFVMYLLEHLCGHSEEQARSIVQELNTRGLAVAAALPERMARAKLSQIEDAAKGKYPFKATIQSAE